MSLSPNAWQWQVSILEGARHDADIGVPVLAQAHDSCVHARKEKVFQDLWPLV